MKTKGIRESHIVYHVLQQEIAALSHLGANHLCLEPSDGHPSTGVHVSLGNGSGVDADFVARDELTGLLGVFKQYNGETWLSTLARDVIDLSMLVQDQIVLGNQIREGAPQRAWTVYLFAILPTRGSETLHRDWLYRGVDASPIGISCIESAAVPKSAEPTSNRSQDVMLRRFLAPLLLRLRRAVSTADSLPNDVMARMSPCLTPTDKKADMHWANSAIEARLRDHMATGLDHAPEHPMQLGSLSGLRIRRFTRPQPDLKFGRLTLVAGPNGSGKTSLLEAIELALTGRLRRLEDLVGLLPKTQLMTDSLVSSVKPLGGDIAGVLSTSDGGRFSVRGPYMAKKGSLPMDAIYMTQERMRTLMTTSSDGLYSWMLDSFGMTVEAVEDDLDGLFKEARQSVADAWQHVLGTRLPSAAGSYSNTFIEGIRDRIAPVISLADTEHPLAGLGRAIDGLRSKEGLGQSPIVSSLASLIGMCHATHERLKSAVAALRPALGSVAELRSAVDKVSALSVALGQYSQVHLAAQEMYGRLTHTWPSNSPMNGPIDVPITRNTEVPSTIRSELNRAAKALDWFLGWESGIRAVQEVARSCRTGLPVREDSMLVAERELPTGCHLHITRANMIVAEMAPHFAAIGRLGDSLDAEITCISEVFREQRRLVDSLRSQVALAESGVRFDEGALAAYRELAANLGLPEWYYVDSPDRLRIDMDNVSAWCQMLAGCLPRLKSTLTLVLTSDALAESLVRQYTTDTYPYSVELAQMLALIDAIQISRKAVRQQVRDSLESVLSTQVREVWEELVWSLTARNWTQPEAEMDLRVVRNATYATVVTHINGNLHPAAAVLNTAEQNIIGLAWFIVAYLYVGRRYADFVILDDPFQNLDDTNLRTSVRILDDIAGVIGLGQVIIASHQESVQQYLLEEFADRAPICDLVDQRDLISMWRVGAESPASSAVSTTTHRYRSRLSPISATIRRD